MEVLIKIGCVHSTLDDFDDEKIIKAMDRKLSYYVDGYKYTKAYQEGRWDGRVCLFKARYKSFPTGLLHEITGILDENSIQYKLETTYEKIDIDSNNPIPFDYDAIDIREYQTKGVDQAIKKRRGIVQSATGSGKSVMIAILVSQLNLKTVIYVPGKDLLWQLKATLEALLDCEIGVVGDGVAEVRPITVSTIQTAVTALDQAYDRYDDEEIPEDVDLSANSKILVRKMIAESQAMIVDESQVMSSKTLQIISKFSKEAQFRYGFSATPFRDSGDDMLIEAALGKKIVSISASFLIKEGYLVKPKILMLHAPLPTFKIPPKYIEIYDKCIVNFDERNEMVANCAVDLIKKKNRSVLVLVRRIQHGKNIAAKLPKDIKYVYLDGSSSTDYRKEVKDSLASKEIDLIISTSIFDQGIDMPTLDSVILAGSGKSKVRALQRVGRVIRTHPGKTDALVVGFIDHAKYLYRHSMRQIEIYEGEKEFGLKLPKDTSFKNSKVKKHVAKKYGW